MMDSCVYSYVYSHSAYIHVLYSYMYSYSEFICDFHRVYDFHGLCYFPMNITYGFAWDFQEFRGFCDFSRFHHFDGFDGFHRTYQIHWFFWFSYIVYLGILEGLYPDRGLIYVSYSGFLCVYHIDSRILSFS